MDDAYFPPRRRELLLVLTTGFIGTALMLLLAWLVARFFIAPTFCSDNVNGLCENPLDLSYNIFMVIGAVTAIGLFARELVFRPALIALPPLILFWSLPILYTNLAQANLLLFMALTTLLVTISYGLFYWLVRFKNFGITFGVLLLIVLALRWFIVS